MNIEADTIAARNGTGPQPATGAHAAPPAAARPRTTIGVVHNDLQAVARAVSHAVPVLEAIAANPLVDELVAEILSAAHAGVAEPYFQAAIDALRAARLRLPAPADGAM